MCHDDVDHKDRSHRQIDEEPYLARQVDRQDWIEEQSDQSHQPCRKPAMRGATRCSTHGGRAEVPDHPANIRRFLSGQIHRSLERQEAYLEGKRTWDSMSRVEHRELIEALPKEAVEDSRMLYEAAKLWKLADTLPRAEWRRRWAKFNTRRHD